jgi:hypothetical protein
MTNVISARGLVFLALFTILALVGMQIKFAELVGSTNQSLTFFQFFGPMAGGFLGVFGVLAVLGAQILNTVFFTHNFEMLTIFRFATLMFGAYYFANNYKKGFEDIISLAVPVLAMLIFWMDPVGQQAWYYALFWTIPVIVKFIPSINSFLSKVFQSWYFGKYIKIPENNLFLRSLGATFTAHAVGGAIWILAAVPMTPEQWTALLPVTMTERLLFAAGISMSYVFFVNVLNAVDKVTDASKYLNIEKKYVLSLSGKN